MNGWVGLVGWPVVDGLPTLVVTHQLQVERRTGKVRRPQNNVLPLCYAANNLEYSGIFLNTWNSGNLCNLREHCNKQSSFSLSFKHLCITVVWLVRMRWWPVLLLELMWNDLLWRSLLHLLFVAITYGKVTLWLWKSPENSGKFFSYFLATLVVFSGDKLSSFWLCHHRACGLSCSLWRNGSQVSGSYVVFHTL